MNTCGSCKNKNRIGDICGCDGVAHSSCYEAENATEKDDIQSIKNIENKYGLMLFRMGLSHLVDVGHRNLTDENVEDSILERELYLSGFFTFEDFREGEHPPHTINEGNDNHIQD